MNGVNWVEVWADAGLPARLDACRLYMRTTGGTLASFMRLGVYVRCSWLGRRTR